MADLKLILLMPNLCGHLERARHLAQTKKGGIPTANYHMTLHAGVYLTINFVGI
jgi:hypothetical protein